MTSPQPSDPIDETTLTEAQTIIGSVLKAAYDVNQTKPKLIKVVDGAVAAIERMVVEARIAELWNPGLRIPENEAVIRKRIAELSSLTQNRKEQV